MAFCKQTHNRLYQVINEVVALIVHAQSVCATLIFFSTIATKYTAAPEAARVHINDDRCDMLEFVAASELRLDCFIFYDVVARDQLSMFSVIYDYAQLLNSIAYLVGFHCL